MTTLSAFQAEQQNEHVLSTLNRDGSRRWLKPRCSPGRFLKARRAVAWFLIALFTLLPYLKINDRPVILLDVARRQFTLLGRTFLPTDTLLLMLLLVMIFVGVFMLTALLGRVWCGWACPQTVYLEFVYRPLERLLEGRGSGGRKPAAWRKGLKYVLFLLISMYLAHTFLAYFVGVQTLAQWVRRSPVAHPSSFLIMLSVTVLMMFDFCFFREQMCIVTCPYGRMQSVMLDRRSLIVSYDTKRGEPRGKLRAATPPRAADAGPSLSLPLLHDAPAAAPPAPTLGDCIDCHMCVTTCPTGIDIRNGLQMECVACAQCIDACDAVMDKINRPRGLIRYSSQSAMEGERRRVLRPRLVLYTLVLGVLLTLFVVTLARRTPADVSVLRGAGMPFNVLPDGRVTNQLKVRVTNRTDQARAYRVEVADAGVLLEGLEGVLLVDPGKSRTEPVLLVLARDAFREGHRDITLVIRADDGYETQRQVRVLGPEGPPRAKDDDHE